MKRLELVILIFLTGCAIAEALTKDGEDEATVPITTTYRNFAIPFQIRPEDQPRYDSLELWHSTDDGKRWERIATVKPQDGRFQFRQATNGMHWFAVRSRDFNGRLSPSEIAGLKPSMKVFVEPIVKPAIVFDRVPDETKPEKAPAIAQPDTLNDYRVMACLAKTRFSLCGCSGLR